MSLGDHNADQNGGNENNMTTKQQQIAAIAQDLETVRDRVDAISVEMQEKSTPWYKTFAGVSGLMALLLSIGSVFYTFYTDRSSSLESKRREIRENLAEIMLLQKEAEKDRLRTDRTLSLSSFVFSNPVYLNRFEVLLDNIDVVNKEIKNQRLSTQTYIQIAESYFYYSSRNDKAFEYYGYALQSATDAFDLANVYLGLSVCYYADGVHFDSSKAREYLNKDILALRETQQKNALYLTCYDYLRAATLENRFDTVNSMRLLDSAKYYLTKFEGQPLYSNLVTAINLGIFEMNDNYGRLYDTIKIR